MDVPSKNPPSSATRKRTSEPVILLASRYGGVSRSGAGIRSPKGVFGLRSYSGRTSGRTICSAFSGHAPLSSGSIRISFFDTAITQNDSDSSATRICRRALTVPSNSISPPSTSLVTLSFRRLPSASNTLKTIDREPLVNFRTLFRVYHLKLSDRLHRVTVKMHNACIHDAPLPSKPTPCLAALSHSRDMSFHTEVRYASCVWGIAVARRMPEGHTANDYDGLRWLSAGGMRYDLPDDGSAKPKRGRPRPAKPSYHLDAPWPRHSAPSPHSASLPLQQESQRDDLPHARILHP